MLDHVQSGQPLRIPAATWNQMIDATRAHFEALGKGGPLATGRTRQAGVVLVRNSSGGSVEQLGILGISTPTFTNTDNLEEFKRQVALDCITPATPTHRGRFVVLLQPCANGAVAPAVAAGVCPVLLNVVTATDTHADVKNADATKLDTSLTGSARILWKEAGTGDKWGIVRFPDPALAGLIPVNVSQTGGADGNKTTAATYTYTVSDPISSQTLITGASPTWARHVGSVNVATKGTAYYNGTTWVLYQIDETPKFGC